MLLLLTHYVRQLQLTKADIRLTRDLVWRYGAERDLALKSDVPQAIQYLEGFNVSRDPGELGNKNLAFILDREREEAARDIIAYLRLKTGKDFGTVPGKWIEAAKMQQITRDPK